MDILSYLTELIKAHKEVGVEGLGTFVKDKTPGRYDLENHAFTPPSIKLSFTSELSENFILKNFISENNNISRDSAEQHIQKFAEGIIESLKNASKADLNALGNLMTDESGVVYLQHTEENKRFEFYGYPLVSVEDTQSDYVQQADLSTEPEVRDAGERPSENLTPALSGLKEDQEPQDVMTDETSQVALESDAQEDQPDDAVTANGKEEQMQDNQETFEEITEQPFAKHELATNIYIETPEGLEPESTNSSKDSADQEEIVTEQPESMLDQGAPTTSDTGIANIWHFDRAKSTNDNQTTANVTQPIHEEKKSGHWTWIAVAIALIAGTAVALYFIKPELFLSAKTAKPAIVKKKIIQHQVPAIDSVAIGDSASTIQDTSLKANKLVVTPPIPADSVTWEIIGASLTKREVKKYVADMKAKGIIAKAVAMPGKRRIKMSIATFYDEESAKTGRRALVKKLNNNDLYIYQNKHTHKPL